MSSCTALNTALWWAVGHTDATPYIYQSLSLWRMTWLCEQEMPCLLLDSSKVRSIQILLLWGTALKPWLQDRWLEAECLYLHLVVQVQTITLHLPDLGQQPTGWDRVSRWNWPGSMVCRIFISQHILSLFLFGGTPNVSYIGIEPPWTVVDIAQHNTTVCEKPDCLQLYINFRLDHFCQLDHQDCCAQLQAWYGVHGVRS